MIRNTRTFNTGSNSIKINSDSNQTPEQPEPPLEYNQFLLKLREYNITQRDVKNVDWLCFPNGSIVIAEAFYCEYIQEIEDGNSLYDFLCPYRNR